MDRTAELDQIIAKYDLNQHPFYQEWVAGTLPVAKLQAYAAEYGHFIATIADGWDVLGMHDIAEEERWHEKLWSDFRDSIGARSTCENAETKDLVAKSKAGSASRDAAIGALYAFEAQQPHTSASKLKGLNAHYTVSEEGKRYFEIHAEDVTEPQLLAKLASELSDEQFLIAKENCDAVCQAMWTALDGVYKTPVLSA